MSTSLDDNQTNQTPASEADDIDAELEALLANAEGGTDDEPVEDGQDDAAKEEPIVMTPSQLQKLVAEQVAAALGSRPASASSDPAPSGVASGRFVKVHVTGTFVSMLNKHMQTVENFEIDVVMPKGYTMGDLRRSLPNKMARIYSAMKRLRSVESHEIIGPATAGDKSDFIPQAGSSKLTKEEVEDGEGKAPEPGVMAFGDTTEYGADGLPPIVNA